MLYQQVRRAPTALTTRAMGSLLATGSLHSYSLNTCSLATGSMATGSQRTGSLCTGSVGMGSLHTDSLRLSLHTDSRDGRAASERGEQQRWESGRA